MENNKNKKEDIAKLPIRSIWIGDIDGDDWVHNIISEIVTFDLEDNSRPIYIFINSEGGRAGNTFKIRNLLLKNISSPIITVGLITVKSAACTIFACGHIRVAVDGTKFLFHNGRLQFSADGPVHLTTGNLETRLSQLKKHNKSFLKKYVMVRPEHLNPCIIDSKTLFDFIKDSPNEELILNPQQAKKLGLVDVVIKKISQLKKIEKDLMKKLKNKNKN